MKIDHTTISFKYGHISTLILYKEVIFLSEIIKQCIANERIDAYFSHSTNNLSSNMNEIRYGCCGAHLIQF